MDRLVVIGNGMAGVCAIEEMLKIKARTAITVFGEERHVNYNRVLLSEVLAGNRQKTEIYLNPKKWYEENGIDLRLDLRVERIDPSAKTVTDGLGAVTRYDHLLIAVGGRPIIPPLPGIHRPGVHIFRSLDDTERIAGHARIAREAVIIGGGLLGLEAARALMKHGLAVTVIHLGEWLMEQQLDRMSGNLLKREVERFGIGVLVGARATEILGNEAVRAVRLSSGRELSADLIRHLHGNPSQPGARPGRRNPDREGHYGQ